MVLPISQNEEVIKVARESTGGEPDSSTIIAISNIQAQIGALQTAITKLQTESGGNYDSEGNVGAAAPTSLSEQLYNKSGAGRNNGEVVIADSGDAEAFTTTTNTHDENVIGVVSSDSPDGTADAMLNNAKGKICVRGKSNCYVNADVAAIVVGDYLATHTVAGYARKATHARHPGIFAQALEAKASGTGIISVHVIGGQPARSVLTTKGDFLAYDTDIVRLPVGTNKYIIVADSTEAKGVKWTNSINLGASTFGDGGTTDYIAFAADGELTLHGTARVNNHIRVGAASFKRGATPPTEEINGVYFTLNFAQNQEESAYYTLIVPFRMEAGVDIDIDLEWFHEVAADVGAVTWGMEYRLITTGEAVEGATATTEQVSGASVVDLKQSTVFSTGLTGGVADEVLGIRIFRNHDDAGDTLNGAAKLIAVHFHFIANKLGQAT